MLVEYEGTQMEGAWWLELVEKVQMAASSWRIKREKEEEKGGE